MPAKLQLPEHPLYASGDTWRVPPASGILDHNPIPQTDPHAILHLQESILQTFSRSSLPVQIIETIPGPWFCQFTIEALPGTGKGFLGRWRAQRFEIQKNIFDQTKFSMKQFDIPKPRHPCLQLLALNPDISPIPLHPVLNSPVVQQATGELIIPLGVDLTGQPMAADLTTFQHLLVGGITGAGKSVFINSLLAGLLCRYSPDELRLILCDGNMVELSPYRDIPHVVGKVVTKPDEFTPLMSWVEAEINKRLEVVGLGSFKLPYLVIVIEHMFVFPLAEPPLSGLLERILPLASQVGVHFVMTDSYPDAKVMSTAVKRQIPARVCFSVANSQVSHMILDQPGAEELYAPGDFLFLPAIDQSVQRLHACMLSRREFLRLLHFWKDQAHT